MSTADAVRVRCPDCGATCHVTELMDQDTPPIAFGERHPGSAIPMLAAIASTDGVLWKDQVSQRDPMSARDAQLDADATIVAAVWRTDRNEAGLSAWNRQAGKRLWENEVEYSGKMSSTIHVILVDKDAIFVAVSGSLQVYDPQTGTRRFIAGMPN